MSLNDLYREAVLDHNRQPRNHGSLDAPTHASRGLNALCGDDIRVELVVTGERIAQAAFSGEPSAITMASASMMTERVRGLSVAEFEALHARLKALLDAASSPDDELRDALGELAALEGVRAYPSRIKSALLPWATLQAALAGEAVASTE